MANPHRGQVTVRLGDVSWVLRFDMNSIAELEENLGVGFAGIFDKDRIGIRVIRECLYCGVKAQHKKVTREAVGKLMQFEDFEYYTTCIMRALELATGQKFLVEDEEVQPDPLPVEEPVAHPPIPDLPELTASV